MTSGVGAAISRPHSCSPPCTAGRPTGAPTAGSPARLGRVPPVTLEAAPLGESDEQRTLAWRDFRSYSAARDTAHPVSSLTYYGTSGTTWESGIGFSSGNNAAVLTADGHFQANRSDSPALTRLRDYFGGWQDAGCPGLQALTPVLQRIDAGYAVRTALPSRPPA